MPSESFERKLREKFAGAEIKPRPELWQTIEQEISPPARKGGLYLLLFELVFIAGLLFSGTTQYFSIDPEVTDNFSQENIIDADQQLSDQAEISLSGQHTQQQPISCFADCFYQTERN